MDVFDQLLNGIAGVMTPTNLLLLAAGVLMGMIVGVMPGLGPSAGLAILLPVTFGLDPTGAIVMLAAVYYGAMYGGTITSVLINTPGESATVATTFDGYPMAKQGRAGPGARARRGGVVRRGNRGCHPDHAHRTRSSPRSPRASDPPSCSWSSWPACSRWS